MIVFCSKKHIFSDNSAKSHISIVLLWARALTSGILKNGSRNFRKQKFRKYGSRFPKKQIFNRCSLLSSQLNVRYKGMASSCRSINKLKCVIFRRLLRAKKYYYKADFRKSKLNHLWFSTGWTPSFWSKRVAGGFTLGHHLELIL